MRLRGAVVGVGYLGRFHAQKYAQLSDTVELVGVCDSLKTNADKIAGELNVKAYTNPKDLIGKVDVVTIATTTTTHHEVAKLFLENGIHCLVEKPLAANLQQAQELKAIASQKNLVLQVGHIERFNPAFVELKKHVKSPLYFEALRLAPFKPRALDVDVVTDLMIHDIDLMTSVMNSPIKSIQAQGSKVMTHTFDLASALFTFVNGAKAHITVNRCYPHAVRTVSVFEEKTHFFADLGQGTLTQSTRKIEDIYAAVMPESQVIQTEKKDAMLEETKAFFAAVSGRSPCPVPAQSGVQAIEIMEKVLELIKSK